MLKSGQLPELLRLIVITDEALAAPRSVLEVVGEALEGGARAVQLRDKNRSAREIAGLGRALLKLTRPREALLFVNDRVDVALAIGADGAHLGPEDLSVAVARTIVPAGFLLGYSTDDPEIARTAEADGADYLGCGAVFGTTTKDVGGQAIGLPRLDEVARAVRIPVVGIGGVTVEGARRIARETGASGVAVVGAVMGARDPRVACLNLQRPFAGPASP